MSDLGEEKMLLIDNDEYNGNTVLRDRIPARPEMSLLTRLGVYARQLFETRRQRRTILHFIAILAAIAAFFIFGTRVFTHDPNDPGFDAGRHLEGTKGSYYTPPTVAKTSFLHFLLPATTPNLNLCKTLVSAAVLNYSTPTLINWDQKFTTEGLSNGGAHLAKIPGILNYLESLGSEDDEDLVVIADGYDVWFQLGPEFLISRYYEANRQANERISRRICGRSSCKEKSLSHISQKIIFSSQKRCWPHSADQLACYAAPPSTLPDDVYGPDTDKFWGDDDENHYLKMRPRWMNSGFIVGSVGALRSFFAEAERRMDLDPHQGSDQGILSDIFGAQEYAREVVRREYLRDRPFHRHANWISSLFGKSSFDKNRDDVLRHSQSREILPLTRTTNLTSFEFNVGLDYDNTFSIPTVFAPRDADWVTFNNPDAPSAYWHIASPAIKRSSLPADLAAATSPPFNHLKLPPFDYASSLLDSETRENITRILSDLVIPLPAAPHSQSSYRDIPLYTNLYLSTVPVTLHHNAWQNGMKRHRQTMWGQPWWSAYTRTMLGAHVTSPRQPVATLSLDANGDTVHEFWSPVEKKGGARLDNGTWVDLGYLCGPPPLIETVKGEGEDEGKIVVEGNEALIEERLSWESELFWVGDEWERISRGMGIMS